MSPFCNLLEQRMIFGDLHHCGFQITTAIQTDALVALITMT